MAVKNAAEEGALQRGAQAVGTAKAGIDQQIKKIQQEIQEVIGASWTGAVAQSFSGLNERWNTETVKLNNILITLEDALSGTHKDQQANEEQGQSTVGNIANMMGA